MKRAEPTLELKENILKIKMLYRQGRYIDATKLIEGFTKELFYYVYYEKFFRNLKAEDLKVVLKATEEKGLEGDISDYSVSQFAKLYETTNCLSEIATSPMSDSLIRSFDLGYLAKIIETCKQPSMETNEKLLRLCVQQLMQFCTLLSYLSDVIDLGEDDFIDGKTQGNSDSDLSDMVTNRLIKGGFKQKFFLYNEERGLLLNEADQTRNIAFKVETFGKLLANIYSGIIDNIEPKESADIPRLARDVIQQAGKDSGKRFGRALDLQFQKEGYKISLLDKIAKWCDFDSDVGFGRFSSEGMELDKDRVEGNIILRENFLTLGRNYSDNNICCFMKGYICGVLEELTGMPLKISHQKKDCSQFSPGGDICMFHVAIDSDAFEKQKLQMKEINMSEEL